MSTWSTSCLSGRHMTARNRKESIMPTRSVKLPATLRRSPPKAQRTYSKTLENAEREYGSGERASRTAMAALPAACQPPLFMPILPQDG